MRVQSEDVSLGMGRNRGRQLRSLFAQLGLLLAVCWLLYGQTQGFAYVWDDRTIFLDKNSLVVDPLSWDLLTQPVLDGTSYMRPLVFFTWFLEFRLFGQNPVVSHTINVVIFCFNVVLVRALAVRLLQHLQREHPAFWATMAAVLYAIHPALIESTAWVSGRFDLLCTSFILVATVVFVTKTRTSFAKALAISLLTLAALMSKELGVVVPVILWCVGMALSTPSEHPWYVDARKLISDQALVWGLIAIAMTVYFILRHQAMGGLYHVGIAPDYLIDSIFKDMLPLEALKAYLLLAILPFGQIGIFHPLTSVELGSLSEVLKNIAVLLLLIWCIYKALLNKSAWAWLMLSALASIALVLHFLPMTISDNIIQDRFITTALAYFAIGLVLFPWRELVSVHWGISPRAYKLAGALLLGGWMFYASLTTWMLTSMWKSDLMLWTWAYQQHPEIVPVRSNYFHFSLYNGNFDIVEKEISRLRDDQGRLSFSDQVIFAKLLLARNDPESLQYLLGLVEVLPKFHVSPDGRAAIKEFSASSQQVADIYDMYSRARLVFEGDFESALALNQIAAWYLKPAERGPNAYLKTAILYASGDFESADRLLQAQQGKFHHYQNTMLANMLDTLLKFCQLRERDGSRSSLPESCSLALERGFSATQWIKGLVVAP